MDMLCKESKDCLLQRGYLLAFSWPVCMVNVLCTMTVALQRKAVRERRGIVLFWAPSPH